MNKLFVVSWVKIYFLYYFLIQIIVLRTEFTPEKLQLQSNSSKCGNHVIDPGEECDCSTQNYACYKCCNLNNCTFVRKSLQCAEGVCCENCLFKKKGHSCRARNENKCDISEYCTGNSADCPPDLWKRDGTSCKFQNYSGYCYQGVCGTVEEACRNTFGKISSPNSACLYANQEGSEGANCGPVFYNQTIRAFKKCDVHNLECGKLHCVGRFTLGQLQGTSDFYNAYLVNVFYHNICTSANVNNFKNLRKALLTDPTYIRNGTPCDRIGEKYGKMCEKQECKYVKDILSRVECPNNCYNRGHCDQHGKCHCSNREIKTSDCHIKQDLAFKTTTIVAIIVACVIVGVIILIIANHLFCTNKLYTIISSAYTVEPSFQSVLGYFSRFYAASRSSLNSRLARFKRPTNQSTTISEPPLQGKALIPKNLPEGYINI